MYDDFGDETDQKILSILNHGKKQQNEIVELLDKSKTTVREHLEYLVEHHEHVQREEQGQNVYYYLSDEGKNLVEPKPTADPEAVDNALTQFEAALDSSASSGPYVPSESFVETASDFDEITSDHYHILDDPEDEALDRFLDIFDEVLDRTIASYENQRSVEIPTMPEDAVIFLIFSADDISSNCNKGKEPPEYRKEMKVRLEDRIESIEVLPPKIGMALQPLALNVDIRLGQKYLLELIKYNKFDKGTWELRRLFHAYDANHDIDKAPRDLERIAREVENERAEEIRGLIRKVKNRYLDDSF